MAPKPGRHVKFAESDPTPPELPKKQLLFDDSDSSPEDGVELKVNQEFARRFEHNKKREELHRLEEKYKRDDSAAGDEDSSESSSEDETEDEDGLLATEELDAQISATLRAIRTRDPRVYNKTSTFYTADALDAASAGKSTKEKPVFLQDYHRERFMQGETGASDDDEEQPPQTYNQEQQAMKRAVLAEFDARVGVGSEDEGSDDGFFRRKDSAKVSDLGESGVHHSRAAPVSTLTEEDVANADKDPELYLSNFMAARAWVPPDGSNWKAFDSDDGDSDLEKADEFEAAFNLRFEDPQKSNEVLKSYARDVAAERSVRREKPTGRKRLRQLEKERNEAERLERKEEKARLKRLKLEQAADKLQRIKKTAGMGGKHLNDEQLLKMLDRAWDDDNWEAEMKKGFGEAYYAENDEGLDSASDEDDVGSSSGQGKRPKKPHWEDDIDITDLVADPEDESRPQFSLTDSEQETEPDDTRPSKKRKTGKDHKKDRLIARKTAKQDRKKLEALVESRMELDPEDTLASASSRKKNRQPTLFRWRETSPKSFGMTARDILLAPSDSALNQFAGIKKYASFRDPEQKGRDKKRLGKKARLRKWRRDVFGQEYEKTGPTFGWEALESVPDDGGAMGDDTGAGVKKKRKRKRTKANSAPEITA